MPHIHPETTVSRLPFWLHRKTVACDVFYANFRGDIRSSPLRSRSRITIDHQPISMCIRRFVRLTEDMPTPISLISSPNDDVYQMIMQRSKDHCHHVVFLLFPQEHHTHSKTQVQHNVRPRVTSLQFRYSGVSQETRERTVPEGRSARERAFLLRAVPVVLLGQFDVLVPPHFVAAPRHRLFPVSASFRITWAAHHLSCCNTNTSHSQSLHAWLIVFLELPSTQHSFGLLRRQSTRRSLPSSQIRSAWNIDCV